MSTLHLPLLLSSFFDDPGKVSVAGVSGGFVKLQQLHVPLRDLLGRGLIVLSIMQLC